MLQRRTARFACRCAVHCCRTNGKIYLKPERTINGNNHGWYKGLAFAVIPPPPSASSWWRNILSHCLPISSLPTYLADLKPLGKSIPTAAETLHPTLFTSKCFIIRYIRNVGYVSTLHSPYICHTQDVPWNLEIGIINHFFTINEENYPKLCRENAG